MKTCFKSRDDSLGKFDFFTHGIDDALAGVDVGHNLGFAL
jgi:hypothetical protein